MIEPKDFSLAVWEGLKSDPDYGNKELFPETDEVYLSLVTSALEVLAEDLPQTLDWVDVLRIKVKVLKHLDDTQWSKRATASFPDRRPDLEANQQEVVRCAMLCYQYALGMATYEVGPTVATSILIREFRHQDMRLHAQILDGQLTCAQLLLQAPAYLFMWRRDI